MNWTLPGTVLQTTLQEAQQVQSLFSSMFLCGGMVLSQVCGITGLESYTVQNWVKRDFLAPPEKKRYSMRQVCRIININTLKAALPMEDICGLLRYINGDLEDERDDLIDDATLYFLFVRLAASHRQMKDFQGREAYLQQLLDDYQEPKPGARERVEKALRIMLTAWAASQLRQEAEKMVQQLKAE